MKISVYIPSYNQKALLAQAIDSVLNQSLKPVEIIVVDDASSDGSQDMIRKYEKKWPSLIRPFFFAENQGVSKVRIKALSEVQGDYVTYVDGDDLFSPLKLEIESKLLCEGEYNLVFSNTAYFSGEVSNVKHIWAADKKNMPLPGNMYLRTFLRQFPRDSLFRMELVSYQLLKSVGFHDPNLKIYEDYDLRIRMAKTANINYTLIPLAFVRTDSHTLSKSSKLIYRENLDYIIAKHREGVINSFPDKTAAIDARLELFYSRFNENTDQSTKAPNTGFIKKLMNKFGKNH